MSGPGALDSLIPVQVQSKLEPDELAWLSREFGRHGGRYPSLEQLWRSIDDVWRETGCDPEVADERHQRFYRHPVWLLNGLYVEQDSLSLEHRRRVSAWVRELAPRRIADVGGGYGTLARMVGETCPGSTVEIIEPHPHPAAIELAERTENVRYREELEGPYDLLIATDVFEHVLDPLGMVAGTAGSLRQGGHYLIANCFQPVVLCHLPRTFHFEHSWDSVLRVLGLIPLERVVYGRAFLRTRELDLAAARAVESRSIWIHRRTAGLPSGVRRFLVPLLLRVGASAPRGAGRRRP